MRKQFQGNSVKENKEGLEQGEQVERRIERAREIKREREMDSPRPRKKNERGGEKSATAEGNAVGVVMPGGGFILRLCPSEAAWGDVMGGVPSALIVERIEILKKRRSRAGYIYMQRYCWSLV